ncbi:MAG: hypothetical protein AAF557_26140 [Pseudomonadota bacterium]
MFNETESSTVIDQATIDHYVAKGRRERSQAVVTLIKSLFAKPEPAVIKAKDTACAV